jgi:siderophore synthetase component
LFWQNDWPTAIKLARQREGGQILHIQLPYSGERIVAVVAAASPTGNYRYRSPFFHKAAAKPWALLDWESQAAVLLRELSLRHGVAPNTELMEQIRDSVAMTTLSLAHRRADHLPADPLQAFVASEQALVYGHPFHPAPKSRQGFAPQDLLRYSPELGAAFPLHWFAVPAEDVVQQSLLAQRCEEVVAAAGVPAVEAGEVAIPVHPWQAGYLRRLPLVRAALASGRLRDLGAHGAPFHATSSVRTLYQPGNPFFYKFSLNVRLTNCVRKNAWYELEGAIQVSRVMRGLLPSLQREFAGLEVLEEPAFLSVDLRDTDATRNREVVEGFGMILRRSVEPLLQAGTVPLLAGALFGNHVLGEQRTRQLLAGIAAREASPIAAVTEHWFSRYVALVMYPSCTATSPMASCSSRTCRTCCSGWATGRRTSCSCGTSKGSSCCRSAIPRRTSARSASARAKPSGTARSRAGSAWPIACSSTTSPKRSTSWPRTHPGWSAGCGPWCAITCTATRRTGAVRRRRAASTACLPESPSPARPT